VAPYANSIRLVFTKHNPWAGLKMPYHAHFFHYAISTRKVGQTDVFGTWSGFISRSVHARLQTSTHRQHFDQLIWKSQPAEL